MPEREPVDRSTKLASLITRRKVAMLQASVSGLDIAVQLGITKQAVSQVINGRSTSQRVQQAIADACSVPVESLFPEEDQASAHASAA